MELIEYRDVAIRYGKDDPVLRHVNFSLPRGGITAFIGPNGSGKTTLMSALDRLIEPCEGSILLDGTPVASLSVKEVARQIAFVPQFTAPGFGYSVFDMVLFGRSARVSNVPKEEDYRVTEQVLERFEIAHLRDKSVTEISGGQKQMVLIARAIAQQTPIVLMDEPTTYLDLKNQTRILNVIKDINRQDGVTFLIALHDPNHAMYLADSVVMVRDGAVEHEAVSTAMNTEKMRWLYGVNAEFFDAFGGRFAAIDYRGM